MQNKVTVCPGFFSLLLLLLSVKPILSDACSPPKGISQCFNYLFQFACFGRDFYIGAGIFLRLALHGESSQQARIVLCFVLILEYWKYICGLKENTLPPPQTLVAWLPEGSSCSLERSTWLFACQCPAFLLHCL